MTFQTPSKLKNQFVSCFLSLVTCFSEVGFFSSDGFGTGVFAGVIGVSLFTGAGVGVGFTGVGVGFAVLVFVFCCVFTFDGVEIIISLSCVNGLFGSTTAFGSI